MEKFMIKSNLNILKMEQDMDMEKFMIKSNLIFLKMEKDMNMVKHQMQNTKYPKEEEEEGYGYCELSDK